MSYARGYLSRTPFTKAAAGARVARAWLRRSVYVPSAESKNLASGPSKSEDNDREDVAGAQSVV